MKSFNVARTMPLDVGILHFVGIGGIGMSGIAEILHNLGYKVQGSDMSENANVERLRGLGINVMIGHTAENVKDAAALVKSTAVKMDNPEVVAARELGLPIIRRSEMLRELMRMKISICIAGTHGKTTTTSLVATVLTHAQFDPTVINGGVLNAQGTNAYLGKSDWMVVEADESDGTFIKIPASVAVVTNIDPEHLDHWGSFDRLREAFVQFLDNLPFYGFAALCIDHPEVQALIPKVSDRRVVTYGFSPQADVRAVNVRADTRGSVCDVEFAERGDVKARTLRDVRIPIPGEHNILNALAALVVGTELGISDMQVKEALLGFAGVKRRFTHCGEVGGITVIDDYGHHPVEINATLKAARQAVEGTEGKAGRVIAVVQPHRYSRVRDLFAEFCRCFNDADFVLVADIHAAGESPIAGITKESLAQGMQETGHKGVQVLQSKDVLAEAVLDIAQPGDLVVCLGAGSITNWAQALPDQLEVLMDSSKKKVSGE